MAVCSEIDGWVFECFDLDTPATEFGKLEPIVNLWRSKFEGAKVPSWASFDFYDFKGWHGKVTKASIISYDPYDWQYDIFGTEFVELYGKDWTNKKGSDAESIHVDYDASVEFYKMACEKCLITRASGKVPWYGLRHKHIEIVELPLSNDGTTVTDIIEFIL
ncbi:MAG: hypothetical protein V7776_11945 [Halopseudomonas aestusnigri]